MAFSPTTIIRKTKTLAYSPQTRRLYHSPIPVFSKNPNLLHQSLHDYSFLRFPQTLVSTLRNGIRVATETTPCAPHTATVGVWIDAGSRFEAPETNGTAHFLEHMLFKGTHRRRSASSIEVEVENMGARFNAYTSREQTAFYFNVLKKDVPRALDMLSDVLQNSIFAAHAIARERGVILREMEEVQKQVEEVIFDHLHSAAFRDCPLGNTILGPAENIRSISRSDLLDYISAHYTGPRMVVSAAGAVKHDEIVNIVDRLFCRLSTNPTTASQLTWETPSIFSGSEVRTLNNDMPVAHFAIAFRGAAWIDAYSIPLMVIQCLLGSWNKAAGVGNCSGSKFARKVAENNLADSIMAFNTNYSDTGLIGIYSTASPNRLYDLSCVLMEEFRRLTCNVSEEEVIRARSQLKSALLLHIDGTSYVAEFNGRQILTYGRIIPFLELFARIDAVDARVIKETAQIFITNKDVAIAAIGPIDELPDYNWFCSQTYLTNC